MKHSFQCVKCHSVDVVKIDGSRYNQTHLIGLSKWGTMHAVLDRFICLNCGYTEEWVQLNDRLKRWARKQESKGDIDSDFV